MWNVSDISCIEFRALSAEFALGVLDARDRALAVAHLERCSACRNVLRELAGIADGLASLAPSVEPPNGFETRVLQALRTSRRENAVSTTRRRALFATIAAAVLVISGFVGWALGGGNTIQPRVRAQLTVANMTSSQRVVGEIVVDRSGSWLSMAVKVSDEHAWATCEVLTARGLAVVVGSFQIVHGYGYWAAPLHGPMTIDGARLVGANGTTIASATFTALRVGNSS